MHRRNLFKMAAGAAAAWPLMVNAQPSHRMAKVGWMSVNSPTASDANMTAFRRGMSELGYVEGQTYSLEPRYSNGKDAVLPELAAELERAGVDVIVAGPYAALLAAKQSTTRIPIVMTPSADPVAAGLVKSLDRPGGNITGITEMMPELTPERIRLLKEVVPTLTRLAIMWKPGTLSDATFDQMVVEAKAVADPMGLRLQIVPVGRPDEFDAAFHAMADQKAEALIVLVNPMVFGQRKQIAERAANQRLPSLFEWKPFVEAGGLMSYGADVPDVYRRAAGIVDQILRGTSPGEIAIQRPALVDMGLNLKTAKLLGLAIPEGVRSRAVQIVE